MDVYGSLWLVGYSFRGPASPAGWEGPPLRWHSLVLASRKFRHSLTSGVAFSAETNNRNGAMDCCVASSFFFWLHTNVLGRLVGWFFAIYKWIGLMMVDSIRWLPWNSTIPNLPTDLPLVKSSHALASALAHGNLAVCYWTSKLWISR